MLLVPFLPILDDRSRRRPIHFKLSAHFFQARSKRSNLFLMGREFGLKILL